MKTFTFASLNKLGDFDPKWGQSYWGETNEQLEPVKFNSLNQNITENDTIEAETIELKTSAKGTTYHQLKKVKVVGSVSASTGGKPVVTTNAQLDRIEAKLDQLLGNKPLTDFAPRQEVVTDEEINEPINLDEIPF